MGQVRQPPQGQAEHKGEARTPTPEEIGKGKQLQNSPPSDQVSSIEILISSNKMDRSLFLCPPDRMIRGYIDFGLSVCHCMCVSVPKL